MVTTDQQFREELRAWLAEHPPPGVAIAATDDDAEVLREWQRRLHAGRWVGIHWPAEYGGRGASLTQLAIYNEELARAGAPALLGRAGVGLVGPTLLAHGTEQQRSRWLPRILSGDDVWCQLFSEPDAGSDLTALSTKAEKRDGAYRVTGQKVWSSYARFADWGVALVRTEWRANRSEGGAERSVRPATDPAAPAHKGISMLAVRMTASGVDVRPLRQITGDSEFNEVFFDDVVVPAENLIGAENEGWRVANTSLANERGASFVWREQVLLEVAIERLVDECRKAGQAHDPVLRQRLAQSWIDVELLRLHNERTLARLTRGDEIGAESSVVKLFWAGASQRLYETAAVALPTFEWGSWTKDMLASRANSIMGGTNEIQRNIIGERLLGLPREPR